MRIFVSILVLLAQCHSVAAVPLPLWLHTLDDLPPGLVSSLDDQGSSHPPGSHPLDSHLQKAAAPPGLLPLGHPWEDLPPGPIPSHPLDFLLALGSHPPGSHPPGSHSLDSHLLDSLLPPGSHSLDSHLLDSLLPLGSHPLDSHLLGQKAAAPPGPPRLAEPMMHGQPYMEYGMEVMKSAAEAATASSDIMYWRMILQLVKQQIQQQQLLDQNLFSIYHYAAQALSLKEAQEQAQGVAPGVAPRDPQRVAPKKG